MITVAELTPADRPVWDDYVRRAPGGLPQHLSAWQDVLARTYGYETPYLLARRDGRIAGVMPLYLVRSRLLGTRAATLPGGLCADSADVARALIDRAAEAAQKAGSARLHLHDTRRQWPGQLHTTQHHVHWLLDVRPGPDALWKGLDGNIRRQVRIARRNELRVEIDRDGRLLDPFYAVFSQFTHQAGTPVFGRFFLQNVVDALPGGFNIAVVFHDGQPIGGYFQLQMKDTVYGLWGATLRHALKLRPVYLAMWSIIADAAEQGYDCLDMGRSPAGSNASKYKGQWGGVSHPVYQQLVTFDGAATADITQQVQSDDKFQLFQRIWPRLPTAVVQFLGPKLRRHIPFA